MRFTVRRGAEARFDALVAATATGIRDHEPSALVYACHAAQDKPRQRIFYELYRDRAAFDVHEQAPAHPAVPRRTRRTPRRDRRRVPRPQRRQNAIYRGNDDTRCWGVAQSPVGFARTLTPTPPSPSSRHDHELAACLSRGVSGGVAPPGGDRERDVSGGLRLDWRPGGAPASAGLALRIFSAIQMTSSTRSASPSRQQGPR